MAKSDNAPKGDRPRSRPRVSAQDARNRLIDATIELLGTLPIPMITTRRIAQQSGLSMMAISRNFGDQEGLFAEVTRELVKRHAETMESSARTVELFEPNLMLRTKLLAWLLQNSADPKGFMPDPSRPIMARLDDRQRQLSDVSERTSNAMNELIALAGEGYTIFGLTHLLDERRLSDLFQLVEAIRATLPEIELRLGWDTPEPE